MTFSPAKASETQAPQPMNLPRDVNGGIDYPALVQMLKQSQNLQDQADILYILFKDKSVPLKPFNQICYICVLEKSCTVTVRIVLKWNNVGISFIRGIDWDTKLHGKGWTIRRLLSDLYEKAGNLKHWGLIRMICGMLRKKVEELDAVSSSFSVCVCK